MSPHEKTLLVMAGSAIFTVGLLSLCAHFASALSRERILLWFGLFAAPYGLALIIRSVLVPEWSDRVDLAVVIAGRVIGFSASVPALLLFREFYGKGWGLSYKWVIWAYATTMIVVLLFIARHGRARVIPSPGIALVILVPLMLVIDKIAGYEPPQIKGRLVMFCGLAVFFLTFSYDRLSYFWTGASAMSEPFGFFALTLCLGYVVSQRVATNEAEWISMAGEMRAARKIQAAILPVPMQHIGGWSVTARYAPMTAVAGDFYGFPQMQEEAVGIIVADVMGHGVPAALVASMVKVSVFAGAEKREEPGEIIGSLNTTICQEVAGQYATAVYVSLDRKQGLGRYSAAGHPPPLLWRRKSQTLQTLDVAGLLLGVRDQEPYNSNDFTFEKGDRLLLYSDGLSEAENRVGLSFGDIRLPTLLASRQSYTTEEFADALLQDVLAWSIEGSGPGQSDDITFVVIDL
jgi:sigma-B regulation protein RsbU (phosphoserine phosphatase)